MPFFTLLLVLKYVTSGTKISNLRHPSKKIWFNLKGPSPGSALTTLRVLQPMLRFFFLLGTNKKIQKNIWFNRKGALPGRAWRTSRVFAACAQVLQRTFLALLVQKYKYWRRYCYDSTNTDEGFGESKLGYLLQCRGSCCMQETCNQAHNIYM